MSQKRFSSYALAVPKLPQKIGLISDTHGLLREQALRALAGADRIIHAGDVGTPEILESLRQIAPVIAVRGNIDTAPWANTLPVTAVVETSGPTIYVLHDLHQLDLKPAPVGFGIVISGHSHKHGREERDGVLYINPGSAGPRRFNLPVTLAWLYLEGLPWRVEFVELKI